MKPVALLFLACLLCSRATGEHRRTIEGCANELSNAALHDCLANVLKKADADLDAAVQSAARRWPETQYRTALQRAQRAWVAYRDSQCIAVFQTVEPGSSAPSMELGCRIRLTRERLAAVKETYFLP